MTGHLAERDEAAQAAPARVSGGPEFNAGWIETGSPLTPEEDGRSYPLIRLAAKDLRYRLKKMKPFMSTEETRYYLNGIYIKYDNQELTLCATNGHVLQEQVFHVEAELSEDLKPFSVICPRAAIEHLIKVIPVSKDAPFLTMQVISDGDDIRFDFFEFEYITSVVKGTFPDYQKVIPAGSVRLQSGLNASYLIDALKALNESAVDICVDSKSDAEHQPHLLTSSKADGVKCVIMPMRID